MYAWTTYAHLWIRPQTRANSQYQRIDTSAYRNATKLRVGADVRDKDVAEDLAISFAYGNAFYIPLGFELLETLAPHYQRALGDRLQY